MSRRSPHTIQYRDLLAWASRQAQYAREKKATVPGSYLSNIDGFTKDVACAEMVERMLKKGLPAKQTDFIALFNEVNK